MQARLALVPIPREPAAPPVARSVFRGGPTVQILALPGSGASHRTRTLYGPPARDVAKAICEQLQRAPVRLRILATPAEGFPLQVIASDGAALALVGADPDDATLAETLNGELAALDRLRWYP